MAELGQIEKPSLESFKSKKKIYCISNVYPLHESNADYITLIDKYWNEVAQHVEKLELAGKVNKIFCESIYVQGDDALKTLEGINENAIRVIKKKIEDGAILFPLEKEEIFGPYLDWAHCIRIVRTPEVFTKVFEFFTELSDKRLKHIMKVIEDNLSEGEAGMLIMKEEDRAKLQFPADIEVFLITPPSYDDIIRWLRDKIKDFKV